METRIIAINSDGNQPGESNTLNESSEEDDKKCYAKKEWKTIRNAMLCAKKCYAFSNVLEIPSGATVNSL